MQPSHTQSGVDLIGAAGACGIGTCLDVRNEGALADLASRLKRLRETLFARVLIAVEEPPRVLPVRDGVVLKERVPHSYWHQTIGPACWGGVLDSVNSSLYNARALLSGPFGAGPAPG